MGRKADQSDVQESLILSNLSNPFIRESQSRKQDMIHFSDYSDPQEHHGKNGIVVPPGLQSSINEIQTRNNIPTS